MFKGYNSILTYTRALVAKVAERITGISRNYGHIRDALLTGADSAKHI